MFIMNILLKPSPGRGLFWGYMIQYEVTESGEEL